MTQKAYRYTFAPHDSLEDVEASLLLAIWGLESLHGEAQTHLDAGHFLDRDRRACAIDAGTPVGRDVNRLFVGFLGREFGPESFRVERLVDLGTSRQAKEVPA